MGFRIHSPNGNRYATNDELKAMIGFEGKYDDKGRVGFGEWRVAGTGPDGEATAIRLVLLDPLSAWKVHPKSSKPRRLHAQCPKCKRLVCAGHTNQHKC